MSKKLLKTGIVLSLILFAGCPARFLQPLFTDQQLTFEPGIVGAWSDAAEGTTYYFHQREGKKYAIILCGPEGDTARYVGSLGRLDGKRYLDTYPDSGPDDFHFLPIHIFSALSLRGDTMTMATVNSRHIQRLIESKKISVPHSMSDGEVILTGSTAELQQLIRRIAPDSGAFSTPNVLVRIKE